MEAGEAEGGVRGHEVVAGDGGLTRVVEDERLGLGGVLAPDGAVGREIEDVGSGLGMAERVSPVVKRLRYHRGRFLADPPEDRRHWSGVVALRRRVFAQGDDPAGVRELPAQSIQRLFDGEDLQHARYAIAGQPVLVRRPVDAAEDNRDGDFSQERLDDELHRIVVAGDDQ